MEISVVIPCYNEQKRLEPKLTEAISYLSSSLKEPFELVFVNDGSVDRTHEILDDARRRHPLIPVEIITYSPNRGKGFAVKTGILNSKGRKIIVMDADFSIDLCEVPKALDALDRCDVVVGTKKHMLTQSVKHQRMPRRILGKGFTMITNVLLGINFSDITCGLKGFRSEAAKDIFGRQVMKGWAYDAETLFLVKKLKYKAVEIPVKWLHVEGSKVSAIADTVRSFRDLLMIIANYQSGRYGKR